MQQFTSGVAAVGAKLAQSWFLYALDVLWTVVGAYLCYLQMRPRRERSFRDLVRFVFPKDIIFHPSARVDVWFMIVRRLSFPVIIVPLVFSSAFLAQRIAQALTLALGAPQSPRTADFAISLLLTATLYIATDFAYFYSHYLTHRIPLLWEFHKVHHSAPVLVPPTVVRGHPVDDIFKFLSLSFAGGIVSGPFLYFYPNGLPEVAVAGINAQFVLHLLVFYNLRHSHLPLRFGSHMEKCFISPGLHHLHHSTDPRHYDRNFGFVLAIWDRLWGTMAFPERDQQFSFGLSNGEHDAYNSVWRLYTLPFLKLGRRFTDRMKNRGLRMVLWGAGATADLAAAGFEDTEIGCLIKPEVVDAETKIQPGVQDRGGEAGQGLGRFGGAGGA